MTQVTLWVLRTEGTLPLLLPGGGPPPLLCGEGAGLSLPHTPGTLSSGKSWLHCNCGYGEGHRPVLPCVPRGLCSVSHSFESPGDWARVLGIRAPVKPSLGGSWSL